MQELYLNVALTTAQTRQMMMNQRNFKHQRSRSHCALIPGLSWSNLEGYYQ
jgi:hypothetical protein